MGVGVGYCEHFFLTGGVVSVPDRLEYTLYVSDTGERQTNNDGSKNEGREGLYIYKNGLYPSLPSRLRAERHTSLAWDGF